MASIFDDYNLGGAIGVGSMEPTPYTSNSGFSFASYGKAPGYTSSVSSDYGGVSTASSPTPSASSPMFTMPKGTVTDANGVSYDVSGQIRQDQDIAQQGIDYQKDYLDYVSQQMEDAYNASKRVAEGQISSLESMQPVVESEIRQGYEKLVPGIERARDERVSGLEQQEEDLVKGGRTLEGGQRRLFNELMTAGGKYLGTSVSEAFGELMGRDAISTIGNLRDTVVKGVNAARSEIGRVKEFYASELNNLQQQMNTAIQRSRTNFQNEINKIRDSIRTSEDEKATARQGALLQFQQSINEIRNAASIREMELNQWAQERAAAAQRAEDFYVRGVGGFWEEATQAVQNAQMWGLQPTNESIRNGWNLYAQGNLKKGDLTGIILNSSVPVTNQTQGQGFLSNIGNSFMNFMQ